MTNHTQHLATVIPVSLYIHIPWCVKKCPYCDFNSYAIRDNPAEEEYVTRLLEDLQQQYHLLQGRQLHSIFIGGGTPSLFSPQSYERLFNGIACYFKLLPETEITLEANPSSSEQQHFSAYRQLGINRLSIGIQSTNNIHLQKLGRAHDATQAQQAVVMARQAGFDTFNLDLMFALPKQTYSQALQDLQTIISWQPPHISWYQLTIEPNTYFHKHPPRLPDDDSAWDMQQQGQALLRQAGYQHYEVSAYSQVNHQCQHNLNYWFFGDYLGIGAGAHSKLTDLTTGNVTRSYCWRNPRDYLDRSRTTVAQTEIIPPSQLAVEFMLNALRLYQPVSTDLFRQRTGLQLNHIQTALQQAEQLELLMVDEQHFKVTERGQRYLNNLVELFL